MDLLVYFKAKLHCIEEISRTLLLWFESILANVKQSNIKFQALTANCTSEMNLTLYVNCNWKIDRFL